MEPSTHVVTTDGAGPYTAIIDPTGTGAFASGTTADVTTQVPGRNGEIFPDGTVVKRGLAAVMKRAGIWKRAANVNKDFVGFSNDRRVERKLTYHSHSPYKSQPA